MKFPTDKKVRAALDRWTEIECAYASDCASGRVACETASAPEMTPIEQLVFFSLRGAGIDVTPQAQIGAYRVDFFIKSNSDQIIIECDGHDFHEKTKEQAQKDKERDRNLQLSGFKVYRFTGSEIWKTDGQCIFDVVDVKDF